MAREPDVVITQSVLDRLLDDDPKTPSEPTPTRSQSFRQLKAALKRDLEWLLNTRRTPQEVAEGFRECNRSVLVYGLPDTSAMTVGSSKDRATLLNLLEETVAIFEPRLLSVTVHMEGVANSTRVVKFRIEGLLNVDPAPEHVSFDTVLELSSGEYEVK